MTQTENDIVIKTQNGFIDSYCADITFFNSSPFTSVQINNAFVLQPGQSISFPVNKDELDTTKYNYRFYATPGTQQLTIITRKYRGDISQKKKYRNLLSSYASNNIIESNCGQITFFNANLNKVTLNNAITLNYFDFFAFYVNEDERDVTKYNLVFGTTFPPTSNLLYVFKKIFVNE